MKPELVIGLVGPAGADLHAACKEVRKALAPYGYDAEEIRLSTLLTAVPGGEHLGAKMAEDIRIERHMDAGDALRRQAGGNALAALAAGFMHDTREGGGERANKAFVLNSLKHPAEVDMLRSVYGSRFILIAVHSPTLARRQALKHLIAQSHNAPERSNDFDAEAIRLMERDERDEQVDHGQNVRSAFTHGDVYVSTAPEGELGRGIERYLALFFGDPFKTPTRDENAMFQAHAAALRSADLSRQVGAVIATREGDVVAVGCNEVPRAFGGQYWPDHPDDKRDFVLGYDSNAKAARKALERAFEAMRESEQLAGGASLDDFVESLRGTRLANITEFGRPVHAEMAALLEAARRGSVVREHDLFTTTFPCHNCARHIIAAGIRKIVYREPYEKSLAAELHEDSLVVDPVGDIEDKVVVKRFVGVGPPKYSELFTMPTRRDGEGNRIPWSEQKATPRLVKDETTYLVAEEDAVYQLRRDMDRVDISRKDADD